MLRLKNLGSGSAGNATLIEGSDGLRTRRLLVDCGLGVRQLAARLDQAGLAWSDIAAIFITHEHFRSHWLRAVYRTEASHPHLDEPRHTCRPGLPGLQRAAAHCSRPGAHRPGLLANTPSPYRTMPANRCN